MRIMDELACPLRELLVREDVDTTTSTVRTETLERAYPTIVPDLCVSQPCLTALSTRAPHRTTEQPLVGHGLMTPAALLPAGLGA